MSENQIACERCGVADDYAGSCPNGYNDCPTYKSKPVEEPDFLEGIKACDLSGDGTCEACQ